MKCSRSVFVSIFTLFISGSAIAQSPDNCFGFTNLESFVGAQLDAPELVAAAIATDDEVANLFTDSADLFVMLPTSQDIEESIQIAGFDQTVARLARQMKKLSFRGTYPYAFPNAFIRATNTSGQTITSLAQTGSDTVFLYNPNGSSIGAYERLSDRKCFLSTVIRTYGFLN